MAETIKTKVLVLGLGAVGAAVAYQLSRRGVDFIGLEQQAAPPYARGSSLGETRITRVAYEEGEVGILELLDSLRVNRLASLRLLDLQEGVREAFIELERVVGAELTTAGGRP